MREKLEQERIEVINHLNACKEVGDFYSMGAEEQKIRLMEINKQLKEDIK